MSQPTATPPSPSAIAPISYSSKSWKRAKRAVRCAPFQRKFYNTMREHSVPLLEIVGTSGQEAGYVASMQNELTAENVLMWLIQVGVLRREVDGQGITDSFRLTPLGTRLLEDWETNGERWRSPSIGSRIKNSLIQWLRLPF
ncbi:MAG: Npun_F0494 family protein [Cyanobacteria bacterium P01_C01_bin.89]